MLTETFIASTQGEGKNPANSSLPKDAAIFLHDFQPTCTLKGHFNKSNTGPNCLAVTTTHVFAAQADRAIISVFNREKGGLEASVALHEHISSIACIDADDGAPILALGTGQGKSGRDGVSGGRVMLLELATGRLVQTPPSHIQPITCLTVDVTGTFLLSGSPDSQIHVWSIPALLSFTELDESENHARTSPIRTLSNHEAGINAIITGHSHTPADIAVSASDDKRCLVWNYRTGSLLHTFLMGEIPLCLSLDPADRGFYAGLASGAIQMVDFHPPTSSSRHHTLYSSNPSSSTTPSEPPKSDQWTVNGESPGAVTSIDVSYDGQSVLAGYASGVVLAWDVGGPINPVTVANLAKPVTNLTMLPPDGFPGQESTRKRLNKSGTRLLTTQKPRADAGVAAQGATGLYVPDNYVFSACFEDEIPPARWADKASVDVMVKEFDHFTEPGNPDLPDRLWERALSELSSRSDTAAQAPTARTGEAKGNSNKRAKKTATTATATADEGMEAENGGDEDGDERMAGEEKPEKSASTSTSTSSQKDKIRLNVLQRQNRALATKVAEMQALLDEKSGERASE